MTYHVSGRFSSTSCDCPAKMYNGTCKHLRWVNYWRVLVEAGELPGDTTSINFEEARGFYTDDDCTHPNGQRTEDTVRDTA